MGSKPKVAYTPPPEQLAKEAADKAAIEANAEKALRRKQRQSTVLSSVNTEGNTAIAKTNTGT